MKKYKKSKNEKNFLPFYFLNIIKKESDFKALIIIYLLAFIFAFTIVFLDLSKPFFLSLLSNPFFDLTFSHIVKSVIGITFFTLFLGSLVLPLIVYVPIVALANGSLMPYLILNHNFLFSLIYVVSFVCFSKYFLSLAFFSERLGKYIIYLLIKREYQFRVSRIVIWFMMINLVLFLIFAYILVLLK